MLTNGTNADASAVMANFNYVLNCARGMMAPQPQGRLTLAAATPVMTSSVSAATTIYYTPYLGSVVPLWNGSAMLPTPWTGDLSNITTNSSVGNAGPAAVVANSNYDLFVWLNGSTMTLTRGPAWVSPTSRGTGAGTTELQRQNGIWINKNAIMNGPAANVGTYVGTVSSDASSQIDFIFGGVGTGGVAAVLGVWNAYNRVDFKGFIGDNTPTWTYTGMAWRAANGSNGVRVSFVLGQQEDYVDAEYTAAVYSTAAADDYPAVAVGLDSTASPSGLGSGTSVNNATGLTVRGGAVSNSLGFHYMQALESIPVAPSGTPTFQGSASNSRQTGMIYRGRF
jgi:hypothetical protein